MDRFKPMSATEEIAAELIVCSQCLALCHLSELADDEFNNVCKECHKQNMENDFTPAEMALCKLCVEILGYHPADTDGMNPDEIADKVLESYRRYKTGALAVTSEATIDHISKKL